VTELEMQGIARIPFEIIDSQKNLLLCNHT
jgi:hypothetical protein